MELYDAMRTAATVRRFRSDPVPDEILVRALDAARFAPSGGNRQGWRVIVVRDPALRTALRDLYLRTWRPFHAARAAAAATDPSGDDRRSRADAANDYAEHLDEVPVHLVVLVELDALVTPFPAIAESEFLSGSSIYPFAQNLLLALRGEGLGAALTMLLNVEEAAAKALLGIPDAFAIAAHIGVGWPLRSHPTNLRRRPVSEFTWLDRFGGASLAAAAPGREAVPAPA